ncbi:MAG: asparagine synthase (glutamine-hydrolyzing) [Acidobacteria bacterium]|jgi:asparagine synthase (glutamine-hydrolysing)|nr:asparagine synthase (glutamine-hydrolyzing) [Acidobacteriota bacterium]
MCGIAGWAEEEGRVDRAVIALMCEQIRHRGPDGHGIWISPEASVGLGHRRLSIIDLSDAAAQPMANERGNIQLVFNGEIYNFRELRHELEAAGHEFKSQTDSEVILHGYEEWGADGCLEHLRGMFAFALWDGGQKQLLIARDRIGIKPLYYAELPGGGLAFASEAKALLAHPRLSPALDDDGLRGYLAYGYVPHERSIFRGIRKLRPGHALRWQAGRVVERRWWELHYQPQALDGSREELVAEIGRLVREQVAAHMVADVPVGSFLSGGVDSSTVTALARENVGNALSTFCVGFDAGSQDDLHYSRLVAEALATEHHTMQLTGDDARRLLPTLAGVMDEPLYDPSVLATLVLAGFARHHVKVALSGTGGDEVFAGYGWFASQVRYARQRSRLGPLWYPLAMAANPMVGLLRRLPFGMRAPGALKLVGRSQPERSFLVRGFFDSWGQRRLLGGGVDSAVPDGEHLWVHQRTWRPDWPLVPAVLNHDMCSFLPDNCLVLLDRTTMAHGLEARVPLLDHGLVEAVFRIPWQELSSGDGEKRLLKEIAAQLVPHEVLTRAKSGFSPPFKVWLREGGMAALASELMGGALAEDGVIEPRFVELLVRRRALRRWNKLWLLIVLEWWYRRWIRGQPVPAAAGVG